MSENHTSSGLAQLPAELILQILSYVDPIDLAHIAQTCKVLSGHSYDDQLWLPHINRNLPVPITDPPPTKSFRELYTAHYPRWFLPRQRVWFGDNLPMGKLLISRYEPQTGCIAAYTVTARRGSHSLQFWEKDREVIIHTFNPKISLDLGRPVVNLDLDNPKSEEDADDDAKVEGSDRPSKYSKEILMNTFSEARLYASFMLCRSLPERAIFESAAVWPPLRFPAAARTRNESADNFNSLGHFPDTVDDISQYNFRMRKWVEYSGRAASPNVKSILSRVNPYLPVKLRSSSTGIKVRMPEDITTFATLPESAYTPTAKKPWQGIWCGDYSGHGCEFLLMLQPDKKKEKPLPEGMSWLRQWFRISARASRRESENTAASIIGALGEAGQHETSREWAQASADLEDAEISAEAGNAQVTAGPSRPTTTKETEEEDAPTGRLEAIKLTGDPNIPRGEYTFVAPDIGQDGFIRVADEEIFRGARIVRSAGHVAGEGFVRDRFTPSQLIMISHDTLAQFWEAYGHISYYQRVDLDALLKFQAEQAEVS